MQTSRIVRRFMAADRGQPNTAFRSLQARYLKAETAVKVFYLGSILLAYQAMQSVHFSLLNARNLDLAWPVAFLPKANILAAGDIISTLTFIAALLAFMWPQRLSFRIGFAVGFMLCGALAASFGAINHWYHMWLWLAIALVFLPSGNGRAYQLKYTLTFATAQGLLLMFYSMAGLWKLTSGLSAIMAGQEGNLAPRGLALTIADRMMQTGTDPLLGPIVIEYYWLSYPMFLFIIYVQLMSVVVAYRPSLHAIWGLVLIAFHVGTFLLMEISFPNHVLALALFLLMSPFQTKNWLHPRTLCDFPIISTLCHFAGKRKVAA